MKQLVGSLRDAPWLTLQRIRGYSLLLILSYIVAFAVWIGLAKGLRDYAGHPLGTDFLNVYAAGLMTLQGHAFQAYDWALHGAVEHGIVGFDAPYYGWHYPPMFLGVAAFAALLPYAWALCTYLIAGFVAYLAAIKRIAPSHPYALLAAVAFPGVFINIGNGQNGFITTALLGAGMSLLETEPVGAGFFLGLLAYKPQFFILIPFVLLIGRFYRAFMATCATAFLTAALSYEILGWETWKAFFISTHLTEGIILEQGATGWSKIQSLFSLIRMWGGDKEIAYALHGVVAFFAVGMLIRIWRAFPPLGVKASALVATALLFTPYLLDYDLMLLAVPVAFLTREGCNKTFGIYEKTFLLSLWILPFVARAAGEHGFILTPFFLLGLLGLCYKRTLPF